jgi:hypothetical protein
MGSSFSLPGFAMDLLQEHLCFVVGRAWTFLLLLAPIFVVTWDSTMGRNPLNDDSAILSGFEKTVFQDVD